MADAPVTDAPTDTEGAAPDIATEVETKPEVGDETATWKAMARKHEKAAKAAQAELTKLQSASLSDQERAVAQARAEGRADALKTANERLLRAEVRALAAGVLADPDDAVHLLDLSRYEADEAGNFDRKAMRRDLEDLVKSKPYLSPGPGSGAGEGGARGQQTQTASEDPLVQALNRTLGTR